ncbi:M16 family metallopeptidase [Mucilaginibacter antarcticus]|uniref:M16 family metallopeptidase n=1 Tax=Mucilaginibacter antarcticus TaxID=1855725 RepID=UPI00362F496D
MPNGLTYYIRPNGQPAKKAQLVLVSKAGSVIETDAQRGMANFIQYMAFKGTRDFSQSEMNAYLSKLGGRYGADTSAFASYDETVYQLTVPADSGKALSTGLNLLANWASHINFDENAVNTTKALLGAKAAAGGQTAEDRLMEQTLPVLLNNSQYAKRAPLGAAAAINTFTAASLKNFYTDWYRPDMIAVIVVGDINPKQVEEMIKFSFSTLRNPTPAKPQPQFNVAPVAGTVVKFATDKDFPYTLFQMLIKHPPAITKTKADLLRAVRINLFNQILNTRITDLTKIPIRPITYGQASYADFMGNQDAFSALAVVNAAQGLEGAVKAIVGETEQARRFGFTLTELEKAKQSAIAQITNVYSAKANKPSANYTNEYDRHFITRQGIPGIDYEYNTYIDNIGKITLAEMNALAAKIITDQNRVLIVEAPESQKANLPTEQTLLKWVSDAGVGLKEYVDDNSIPLMSKLPEPGKAESIKVDSILQVTNLTLSNGMKVILKPTKFTPNQVLVSGFAFGGTSLASDADFVSANLAASVISNSGVAGYTQTQLVKKLRDKGVSVSPYIGDVTQGISGYTTADNFDDAMQLIHLYFTSPRKDADVWKAYVNQAQTALTQGANEPGVVYQDTIVAVLNGYAPRFMPMTAAKLNAASLDKAYNFYKARFADAGNFTFTLTGDFNTDAVIPYLETYLGSLPGTNSKETFKNLGIHPPTGQVTKTVYKGASTRATVQLVYSGKYDYSEANNLQMDALEEVLNIRLADSLKDASILSPSIRVNYAKNPEGNYKVTIAFLTDVANTDKAVEYILTEISKLKQTGPTEGEIKMFILRQARNIQGQYKQNTFWQASLSTAAQNQQDPGKILYRIQQLDQATPQSVKAALNKYLGSNLIKLILLPEKN